MITPGHKIALARSHSNRTVRSAFEFYGPTPQSEPANIIDSKFIVTYRTVLLTPNSGDATALTEPNLPSPLLGSVCIDVDVDVLGNMIP